MAQEWYLLTSSPPIFNSGFEQEEFDNYAVDGFNELLTDSPLSTSVVLSNSDLTTNTTIKAIIQNTSSDSEPSSIERQILTKIGTLQTGKYITYKNKKWLITGLVDDNKIYEKAVIKYCQHQLKWQNSSGTIITRYAVAEKPIAKSLNEGTIITTSDKMYSIKIPYDSETQNLHVGKRFLLEKANGIPLSYSLTSYDGISGSYGQGGILNITLTQDEYNSTTDNADLMIADYFTPIPQPTGNAQILFVGEPEIYVGGSLKTFTAKFVDNSGNVLDLVPVWTWDTSTGDKTKFSDPVISGNTFKIKALYYPELIGSTVEISLTDSDGLYSTSLEIEVIDLG